MKKFIIFLLLFFIIISGTLGYLYFTIQPDIEIIGNDDVILNVNEKFEDEGAEARVFGRNITSKIKVINEVDTGKIGTYNVIYKVQLNYLKKNNYVTRTVKIVDKEQPVISLKGEENITIIQGEKYIENGYDAVDKYDGDVTNNVKIENKVDTSKPGNYEIIYRVKDSSGNENVVKRNVTVKKKIIEVSNITSNVTSKKNNTTPKVGTSGSGRGIAIFMYHYFYDKNNLPDKKLNANYLEIHDFEDQMKYLHDNNYYFPSWQEVADFVDGKIELPQKSVVITVDDGDKSFFDLAIPVLNKYNIKATSFIITSKSSAKKIPKYKSDNINFQSHTHNMHRGGCTGGHGGLFRCIDYQKGLDDLKQSQLITGSSDALAYPYGDVTPNVLSITRASGFKVAVTTSYGKAKKGMDRLQLPRVRISRGISLQGFKSSL